MLCYKYKTRYGKKFIFVVIFWRVYSLDLIEGLKLTQMSVDKKTKRGVKSIRN